jgi:hypothetical protein
VTAPSVVDERRRLRTSRAGAENHPGLARRVHPLPGRDLRFVRIPPPPGPPPVTGDGTWLVWAPWSRRWQVLEAPCRVCDLVVALVMPVGLCRVCAHTFPELTTTGRGVE